jgi:hypothetical protein
MAEWEIKSEKAAKRCEICHKNDLFDAKANTCLRCNQIQIQQKVANTKVTQTAQTARFPTLLAARVQQLNLFDSIIKELKELPSQLFKPKEDTNNLTNNNSSNIFSRTTISSTPHNQPWGFLALYMICSGINIVFIFSAILTFLLILVCIVGLILDLLSYPNDNQLFDSVFWAILIFFIIVEAISVGGVLVFRRIASYSWKRWLNIG